MGEWMSAEVYVRVPDEVDIGDWLHGHSDDRTVLGTSAADAAGVAPPPISDLLAAAATGDFEWVYDSRARLLASGDTELEVNFGLHDHFADVADALRAAGWGYHFESAGKYELPGECWEWMPDWPAQRTLVQAGDSKALDADNLREALAEARESGVDPGTYLATIVAPWPGWSGPTDAE